MERIGFEDSRIQGFKWSKKQGQETGVRSQEPETRDEGTGSRG